MLEINNITKSYKTGDFVQQALKGINIKFRKNEFVAILGQSGSGKTTLLNILGGLDKYDNGDMLINSMSTKNFRDSNWDAYRNNCVGFIFQNYNLITHISILSNVEMSMTLSNVSKSIRRKKAMVALEKVGLKEHMHKKPNQLSGGQMQRVAIARALVNDPEIILADEPTGALDSDTSVQIMEMIKEIAKDKLVIMVTHNPELASEYSTRTVELKDGNIISDTNPYDGANDDEIVEIKKTKMSYFTALSLSFNNILTKKGRTLLTALASSIGIIGIALILSLSNGFDMQISDFEKNSLSSLPIMISSQAMDLDVEAMAELRGEKLFGDNYTDDEIIYLEEPIAQSMIHTNKISDEYIEMLENLDTSKVSGLSYTRATALNFITKIDDEYKMVDTNMLFTTIPSKVGDDELGVIEENFDLLYGNVPSSIEEVLIIVDSRNKIPAELIEMFGFDINLDNISFEEIIGKEIKLAFNEDVYTKMGDMYIPNQDLESVYNSDNNTILKVSGIIRGKEDNMIYSQSQGVLYGEELVDYVIEKNKDSDIVIAQKDSDSNILTHEIFESEESKDQMLAYLGAESLPMVIQVFPTDFESKEYILSKLDEYNENVEDEDVVVYTDMGDMITSLSSNIMDGITIVLVAFSAISLVVSSIMIGIITYISVLERTKEIGVLRSLGARKKDITRVFNAETAIIGLFSGTLGITIAGLLTIPTNVIIYNLTSLKNVAVLSPIHAAILIAISFVLTVLGGYIPAIMASKKDPVEALRTE